jgi:hypothetical protein
MWLSEVSIYCHCNNERRNTCIRRSVAATLNYVHTFAWPCGLLMRIHDLSCNTAIYAMCLELWSSFVIACAYFSGLVHHAQGRIECLGCNFFCSTVCMPRLYFVALFVAFWLNWAQTFFNYKLIPFTHLYNIKSHKLIFLTAYLLLFSIIVILFEMHVITRNWWQPSAVNCNWRHGVVSFTYLQTAVVYMICLLDPLTLTN